MAHQAAVHQLPGGKETEHVEEEPVGPVLTRGDGRITADDKVLKSSIMHMCRQSGQLVRFK